LTRRFSVGALAVVLAAAVAAGGCASRAPAGPATTSGGTVTADATVPAAWAARVRVDVAAAAGDVARLLPGRWSARVDTRLVASDARLRAEAGWTGAAAGPRGTVAAVAVLPLPPAGATRAAPSAEGGRLIVDLEVYRGLSADGRRIVLRHELTHVATAAWTPPGMPTWLVEGFAEEVGHEGVVACSARLHPLPGGPGCPNGDPAGQGSAVPAALTVDRAAAELAARVRGGAVPTAMPADAAFDGADGRLAQTYEEAWLACRFLAERLGLGGLARLYRDVGARLTGDSAVDGADAERAALLADAGLDWPRFEADWSAYLAASLGPTDVG
jgi:hypothetical protein